ncbi:hypothetical protein ACKP2L_06155 [Oenococcus alcoholitolerans]|uniref:hypothetical protein n=1 Tax=Oenococcus alcoholitolerans TaxID=931074 RepID=UPI003F720919
MYDDRPFLKLFLLIKKIFIAVIAMTISIVLTEESLVNNSTRFDEIVMNLSIYGAIFVSLLNVFQAILLFTYLNRKMKIVYLISAYLSNLMITAISFSHLQSYPFLYLGLFAGILGLLLLTYELIKLKSAYFSE